jgi:hypothetical protein
MHHLDTNRDAWVVALFAVQLACYFNATAFDIGSSATCGTKHADLSKRNVAEG